MLVPEQAARALEINEQFLVRIEVEIGRVGHSIDLSAVAGGEDKAFGKGGLGQRKKGRNFQLVQV